MTAAKQGTAVSDDQDAIQEPQANGATPGRRIVRLEDIAAASDIQTEWVAIPEWAPPGASAEEREQTGVYVRALNGRERADWQAASVMGQGKNTAINFRETTIRLVMLSAVDEEGKRVFNESHRVMLEKRSSAVLERIGDVATRLSGIGDEEMDSLSGKDSPTPDDSTSD